jgi:hypothetical protein
MLNTSQVIVMARKHVADSKVHESSARVCLSDAIMLHNDGNYQQARARAIRSLEYSVGAFHSDYLESIGLL